MVKVASQTSEDRRLYWYLKHLKIEDCIGTSFISNISIGYGGLSIIRLKIEDCTGTSIHISNTSIGKGCLSII